MCAFVHLRDRSVRTRVTWKLLHSCSISPCCSSHTCCFRLHLQCTADTETGGPQWLRGHSWHWRNLPHLTARDILSSFRYVYTQRMRARGFCTVRLLPCGMLQPIADMWPWSMKYPMGMFQPAVRPLPVWQLLFPFRLLMVMPGLDFFTTATA